MAGKKSGSAKKAVSRGRGIVSRDDLRRINEIQALEAESRSLAARLSDLDALEVRRIASGDGGKAAVQALLKRQAAVTAALRETMRDRRFFSTVDLSKDRYNASLIDIVDLLWPWSVLTLPTVTEGISQSPGSSKTSGEIGTSGLFVGTGAFGGTPENDSSQEQWWVHNWDCVATLPPAPRDGPVSYRFAASIDALVYHVEGTGTLHAFITVGTTSDVNQPITNWQTVNWPIDTTLPQPGQVEFGGGGNVTGAIQVKQGKQAAIGIIFGVVVSVIDGYVMFLPNSTFGAGLVGGTGSGAWGKLEYRFNPVFVEQFVQQALVFDF